MSRILPFRSTWTTTRIEPQLARPTITKRLSTRECFGSGIVRDAGSAKTVHANSNVTPCFAAFVVALDESHSKAKAILFNSHGAANLRNRKRNRSRRQSEDGGADAANAERFPARCAAPTSGSRTTVDFPTWRKPTSATTGNASRHSQSKGVKRRGITW